MKSFCFLHFKFKNFSFGESIKPPKKITFSAVLFCHPSRKRGRPARKRGRPKNTSRRKLKLTKQAKTSKKKLSRKKIFRKNFRKRCEKNCKIIFFPPEPRRACASCFPSRSKRAVDTRRRAAETIPKIIFSARHILHPLFPFCAVSAIELNSVSK